MSVVASGLHGRPTADGQRNGRESPEFSTHPMSGYNLFITSLPVLANSIGVAGPTGFMPCDLAAVRVKFNPDCSRCHATMYEPGQVCVPKLWVG